MRVINGYKSDDGDRPTIALGNFDGVHRGHQAVIEAARGAVPGAPLAVVTFDPHPRAFFAPDTPAFSLTLLAEKTRKLRALGVETTHVLRFDESLSSMTPEEFVREVLVDGLNVCAVTVGGDFRFGAKRAGNTKTLAELGAVHGFSVTALDSVADEEGALYSSSSARAALREGKPEDATAILGSPHRIRGVVEMGDQRGRQLSFPTANLALDGIIAPKFGVYAVEVEILEGAHKGHVSGVANLGMRPTFEKTVPILEAHLFDFEGDLYGTEIAVSLISFIRDEKKFSGLPELTAQISADAGEARRILTDGPIKVNSDLV